jgi:hypothetical protein
MKPTELYQLIEVFDKMFTDDRFTLEARLAMGSEFLNSMPPASLIKSSSTTYRIVHNYIAAVMQGAIDGQAKRVNEPEVKQATSKPTDQASMDGKEHAHASNKTDEGRGRGKVAKTPGAPAKRGRKK